jgi:glycosyltransferase involved in cell wall biosynthesis
MSNFSLGGAGNSISKLCLSLPRKNYQISIICLGKCDYKHQLNQNKIQVIEIKKKKILFSINEIHNAIIKLIEIGKKNILISNIHYNNVILAHIVKKNSNIKVILVERTPIEELDIYFSFKDFIKKKILKILVKFYYNYSDAIIANSFGIKKGLIKKIKKPVKVIYPPSLQKISFLKVNSNKNKINKIICLSRLSKEKNLDCAINAFKYLKDSNVSLTIYGNGEEEQNLKKLIIKNGLSSKVFIKKHTNDINKVLKNYQILISPSLFEGCSNSVIEALNHNLIVILSNCPGGNFEILSNGKNGLLFESNNPHDLSLKIKKVLDKPKFYYKKSQHYKVDLKRFLLSKNVSEYDKLFNKI